MAAEKDVFSVLSQAARAASSAPPASRVRKRKSATTPPPRQPREGSSFATCPLCFGTVALALLDAHVGSCDGDAPIPGGSQAATLAPAAPRARSPPPPSPQPPSPPPPHDDDPPCTKNDRPSALAELMRAGREAARVHCFYAERRDGRWWWWWFDAARPPAHVPPAAWSADIALALPPPGGVGAGRRSNGPKATVRIATNVPPDALAARSVGPPPPPGLGASLLKSALQKNVRLGRVDAAAAVAAALARLDAGELARRLPIILIEDAILHPALPHAVWTMVAIGKGYAPPRAALASLVRLAAAAAAAPVKDDPAAWPKVDEAPALATALDGLFSAGGGGGGGAAAALAADEGALMLTRCLYMRSAYGGMPGDVAMMDAAARVWALRLAGAAPPPPPPPVLVDAPSSTPPPPTWPAYLAAAAAAAPSPPPAATDPGRPLHPSDIPLAAVDFHVSAIADDLLLLPDVAAEAAAAAVGRGDGRPDAKRHVLERAMWLFRSGRNGRPLVAGGDDEAAKEEKRALLPLWRAARGAADAWSADFIKTRWAAGGG